MSQGSTQVTALVAHGKNWELPIPDDPAEIQPSFDTRLTAEAAGILYTRENGRPPFDWLILSAGHTAGPEYPSEAEAMRDILRERFDVSQVPDEDILMEEDSFDTAGDLKQVNELCRKHKIGGVALLTVGYHLPRVRRLARTNLDVPVIGVYKSDEVVATDRGEPDGFYLRSIVKRARESHSMRPLVRVATSLALEGAAWGLTVVDPSGEGISRKVTSVIRHQ